MAKNEDGREEAQASNAEAVTMDDDGDDMHELLTRYSKRQGKKVKESVATPKKEPGRKGTIQPGKAAALYQGR